MTSSRYKLFNNVNVCANEENVITCCRVRNQKQYCFGNRKRPFLHY